MLLKTWTIYFNIVQERFLLPITPPHSNKMFSHTNFPSLFLAQSFKIDNLIPRVANKYKKIPCDLSCPSVQTSLRDQVYKTCDQYFASIVMLRHSTQHKQVAAASTRPVRPTRLVTRRQRKMMFIIENQEKWFDEQT